MTKRLILLFLCVLGCHKREAAHNVVTFNLPPAVGSPVLAYSNHLEAQREGDDLVVKLDNVGFAYDAQDNLELRDASITTYRKDGVRIAESDRAPLPRERPEGTNVTLNMTPVRLRVKGAGSECESGCIVALNLYFNVGTPTMPAIATLRKGSNGESYVQSDRASLDLAHAATATAEAPSPPIAAASGPCRWLSESEASAALGQQVVYRDPPAGTNDCNLGPRSGRPTGETILWLDFSITEDPASYNTYVQSADAVVIAGLGDRAVWDGRRHVLAVVRDKKSLLLQINDVKVPSSLGESDLRQRAVAAAEKILGNLR